MEELQHPLEFVHKFNLYKLSGLLIEDDDLQSIARVYGVSLAELAKVDESFQRDIAELAGRLPSAKNAPAELLRRRQLPLFGRTYRAGQ